jgi:hypothetical protein
MQLLGDVGQVDTRFGPIGGSVNVMKDRRTARAERTMGMKIFLGTPIELGDLGQVEATFDLFGHCVNLDARYVHDLHRTFHMLGNHFGHT